MDKIDHDKNNGLGNINADDNGHDYYNETNKNDNDNDRKQSQNQNHESG
jgi:hypothetical protein